MQAAMLSIHTHTIHTCTKPAVRKRLRYIKMSSGATSTTSSIGTATANESPRHIAGFELIRSSTGNLPQHPLMERQKSLLSERIRHQVSGSNFESGPTTTSTIGSGEEGSSSDADEEAALLELDAPAVNTYDNAHCWQIWLKQPTPAIDCPRIDRYVLD